MKGSLILLLIALTGFRSIAQRVVVGSPNHLYRRPARVERMVWYMGRPLTVAL